MAGFTDLLSFDPHEDDEKTDQFFFLLMTGVSLNFRETAFCCTRLEWHMYTQKLQKENSFERMYRMSLESFNKLLEMLRKRLTVNAIYSKLRTGQGMITPEIILHCVIRWLAGGSYLDIRTIAEISVPSFYRIVAKGMKAIVQCEELKISFPKTLEEQVTTSNKFMELSSHHVIKGCVGCLNGWLCSIKTPSKKETRNSKCFFSGHYQKMGINVQAVCDADCKFTYFAIAAPGGANDCRAYSMLSLKDIVDKLKPGQYIIADNAYVTTEHLITPFCGSQREEPEKDAFNFYLSQVCICIEMAFGLMTTKWRILRGPLQVKLKNIPSVLMSIVCLHNFCISERPETTEDNIDVMFHQDNAIGGQLGYIPSDVQVHDVAGDSMIRDIIVKHISDKALTRPM